MNKRRERACVGWAASDDAREPAQMYCHRFTSDFNTGWKWSWHAWPIIAARARPAAAIAWQRKKAIFAKCSCAKMTVKSCGSHFVMIFTLCSREACRRCRAALQHLEHSVCAPYMRWSVQIAPTDQRHWSVGAIPTDQNSLVGRDRPASNHHNSPIITSARPCNVANLRLPSATDADWFTVGF